MLATLVIGLREGLEAALIVGIIAAFLRNNGHSRRPMWVGVGLAVVLSLAVGIGLDLVEQSLPQAAQEAMESVIGAVAIFFVTTMIVWMSAHARGMRKELEAGAAAALGRGSAVALAVMAFLAVLKEGFETSVFLLATFSAAQSAALAATGAVIGVLIAVGIGWGIYAGGVKLDLSRFFRWTGAFLILVAAGLTITTLRTAHEAGWLDAGQQPTVSLARLVAPGSVQSALITGVLGIPADPRLIEVAGWFAYLVPVAVFVYWPPARRLRGSALVRFEAAVAAVLAVTALVLAVALPRPTVDVPAVAPLAGGSPAGGSPAGGSLTGGTARLTAGGTALLVSVAGSPDTTVALPGDRARREQHDGVDATAWTVADAGDATGKPATVDVATLTALSGGRLPVGLSRQLPGPFAARWSVERTTSVWTADGVLLDASRETTAIVTLSGGGLLSPRTLSVADPAATDPAATDPAATDPAATDPAATDPAATDPAATGATWQVSSAYRATTAAALAAARAAEGEHGLWAVDVPILLGIGALLAAAAAARGRTRRPPPRRDNPRLHNPRRDHPRRPAAASADLT